MGVLCCRDCVSDDWRQLQWRAPASRRRGLQVSDELKRACESELPVDDHGVTLVTTPALSQVLGPLLSAVVSLSSSSFHPFLHLHQRPDLHKVSEALTHTHTHTPTEHTNSIQVAVAPSVLTLCSSVSVVASPLQLIHGHLAFIH